MTSTEVIVHQHIRQWIKELNEEELGLQARAKQEIAHGDYQSAEATSRRLHEIHVRKMAYYDRLGE